MKSITSISAASILLAVSYPAFAQAPTQENQATSKRVGPGRRHTDARTMGRRLNPFVVVSKHTRGDGGCAAATTAQ